MQYGSIHRYKVEPAGESLPVLGVGYPTTQVFLPTAFTGDRITPLAKATYDDEAPKKAADGYIGVDGRIPSRD
jgi:hypothetical protein